MRIKGTGDSEQGSEKPERGLAMALDGNGRWAISIPNSAPCTPWPKPRAKSPCTGATPVAATNCLNFGNPEKPEIMAQLSAAIDGIAEACTALGTPITGGNVSLYNETRGEGIYPTPVLGIVGILDDVTKAVPAHFQREKDAIVLLWPIPRGEEPDPNLKVPLNPPPISQYPLPALEREPRDREQPDASDAEVAANLTAFGSSEFAKVILGGLWGTPPALDLDAEADLHNLLADPRLAQAHSFRARHLRRRHRRRARASRIHQRHRRHRRAGSVAPGPPALRPLRRARLHRPRHRRSRATSPRSTTMAGEHNFFSARIGTTGGSRLEISVDGELLHLRAARRASRTLGLRPGSQSPRRGPRMSRLLFQGVDGVADDSRRIKLP